MTVLIKRNHLSIETTTSIPKGLRIHGTPSPPGDRDPSLSDNHDKTRKILVSSLNRWGEERVRSMLHAEDAEGNSVLKLASNASGENATGDSTLKVMLLSCSRHVTTAIAQRRGLQPSYEELP